MRNMHPSEEDAQHWEKSAASSRLEAKRARSLESVRQHEKDAEACEDMAKRIRANIAMVKP